MLKLYNSLTKKIEEFIPLHPPNVGLYTCGMTVYDYAHIGHGRKYVGDDILRRVLMRFGYNVTHVQNVTDVGHLVSDADEGEDKLEKGAKKTGKTVWEVAQFFTDHFYSSMDKLNILRPDVICKATDHIEDQINLITILMKKGYAYDTPEAVYFEISKFNQYGTLFGQKLTDKKTAVRSDVYTGEHKKNPTDFALWFKRVGRFADHAMHWESPWGVGFPGWHIECSAMSMKYLGETIDIHTGGIEHTAVHHPNEIAQSEAATGKQFVRFWIHYGHLMIDGAKMSKSLGNVYTVDDIIAKTVPALPAGRQAARQDFDPLALRYFYLTSSYSKPMNFTWEALGGAQNALEELYNQVSSVKRQAESQKRVQLSNEKLEKVDAYRDRFNEALANDLNTPQALAVVWEIVKSNIPSQDKLDLLLDFDEVLGLDLTKKEKGKRQKEKVPLDIQKLIQKREELRNNKKFAEADRVRKEIEKKGFNLEDTSDGTSIHPKNPKP